MKYRFRKFAPVDRDFPLFELISGDSILLDIGFSNAAQLEVAFHEGIGNTVISLEDLLEYLKEGRRLAENDMAD